MTGAIQSRAEFIIILRRRRPRRRDKAMGPGEIIEHDVAPECLKSSDDRATLRMQSKDGEIINDSARDKSEAKRANKRR